MPEPRHRPGFCIRGNITMVQWFNLPWPDLAVGFGLCLLISALGFLRTDWFISIGYGVSVSALAVWFAWAAPPSVTGSWLQAGLLCLYGLRLSEYLIARERSASFARELEASKARSAHITSPARLGIWFSVSALYVAMAAPLLFVLLAGDTPLLWPGVVVMAAGLGLEITADWQKSASKKREPNKFVRRGVYRCCRYPNYLGEILFWLGNVIAGVGAYHTVLSWGVVLVGFICIFLIMLGSARRLELKQGSRYGDDPEYQVWVSQVPVLFPFVPVYSLRRLRVYLG